MPPEDYDPNWTGSIPFMNIRQMLKNRSPKQAMADSWKWFMNKIRGLSQPEMRNPEQNPTGRPFLPRTKEGLLASPDRFKENIVRRERGLLIGRMYFFAYDPKWKDKLPYYDTFPLVFPIRYYKDGFLGINMHYLDIRNRSALFGRLLELATNKRFNDRTRLRISYSILQQMGNLHEPCLKRYLLSHVRSAFIFVHPSEWEQALFLPVESFEKAPNFVVWRESRKKL
jgi:hypothetical protein